MSKKITDSDLLAAMAMHLNYDSTIYGSCGHYSLGSYYNLFESYKKAEETDAAKIYENSIKDKFKKAYWIQEM